MNIEDEQSTRKGLRQGIIQHEQQRLASERAELVAE